VLFSSILNQSSYHGSHGFPGGYEHTLRRFGEPIALNSFHYWIHDFVRVNLSKKVEILNVHLSHFQTLCRIEGISQTNVFKIVYSVDSIHLESHDYFCEPIYLPIALIFSHHRALTTCLLLTALR